MQTIDNSRDTAEAIARFLRAAGWEQEVSANNVRFLASGEYNENWLVEAPECTKVFRINHGSQLGLGQKQITYEYTVLLLLKASGVTPVPYAVDSAPWETEVGISGGCLYMSFIEGGPLDYSQHTVAAAEIFAAVHTQPVPDGHGLLVQADPVHDIIAECEELLGRYPEHPKRTIFSRLSLYRDEVAALGEQSRSLFAEEPMVVVNTEVNSGNFLLTEKSAALVDWEKAVVSCRYQDLGHFLVPTTTLWKTSFVYTDEGRREFLRAYRSAANLSLSVDELALHTRVMERTILLRGLSWCYMAWYEYTNAGKALQNADTFATIERYLDSIEWFLQ